MLDIQVNRQYKDRLFKLIFREKEEPERQVLELSDAFPEWVNKENTALSCKAVVLNINLGYNRNVMEKCKKLKEYAQFIARIRKYLDENNSIEVAVDKATDECIAEGIRAMIKMCQEFHVEKVDVLERVMNDFSLSEADTKIYIDKYWE